MTKVQAVEILANDLALCWVEHHRGSQAHFRNLLAELVREAIGTNGGELRANGHVLTLDWYRDPCACHKWRQRIVAQAVE